jgi:adenosylmethionine-8-amino-7-oxononanoate aminotransferase
MVQGAAGMIVHPPGYLKGVRELSRRHRTLLIADEVAVGFGKTGSLFACDLEGVSPDFLCLAKGLTGGYMPLAATLTTEEVHSAFFGTASEGKTFYHGHTYAGNPLGAAVALANLRIFDEERTLERLVPKVARLEAKLAEVARLPHVGDVRQKGLIAGIELVEDVSTKEPFPWDRQTGARVCRRARDFGLLIRPLGDVIVVMPPISITEEEIDWLIDRVIQSIRDVVGGIHGGQKRCQEP